MKGVSTVDLFLDIICDTVYFGIQPQISPIGIYLGLIKMVCKDKIGAGIDNNRFEDEKDR